VIVSKGLSEPVDKLLQVTVKPVFSASQWKVVLQYLDLWNSLSEWSKGYRIII